MTGLTMKFAMLKIETACLRLEPNFAVVDCSAAIASSETDFYWIIVERQPSLAANSIKTGLVVMFEAAG